MTCEDAMVLISGHLDGANTQEEESELFAHLQRCSGCRDLLAAFESADAGIMALEAEPPASLSARILDAVRQEPRRRRITRPWMLPIATAAALAIVLWAGIRTLPRMGTDTTAANTALQQLVRADTTAETASTTETAAEAELEASAAMPESYYGADSAPEEPASTSESETDAAVNAAVPDLERCGAELCTAESAAVLVLQAWDPSLDAYDQEILQEGMICIRLPDSAAWDTVQAAHPDASVYMPDAEPAVYYVLTPLQTP